MATIIKTITSIEFSIQIKYTIEENIIIQSFVFLPQSKKYFKYVYDTRFVLNEKVESLITKNILSGRLDNVFFVDKIYNEKNIDMIYRFEGEIDFKETKTIFVTIHIYFPPNTGCKYCSKAETKGEFIYCPERNKTYLQPIKRCLVFKQKQDMLVT